MTALPARCRATRAWIPELLERRSGAVLDSPGAGASNRPTAQALAHAERCTDCRAAIEAAFLVDYRLRRYGLAVRQAPVPDAWPSLRPRLVERRRDVWRWRAGLGGLLVGAAIVLLAVGPTVAIRGRVIALQEVGVEPALVVALRLEEERREAAVLAGQLRARSQPPPASYRSGDPRPDPRTEADGTPRWPGPDGQGVGGSEPASAPGSREPRTA